MTSLTDPAAAPPEEPAGAVAALFGERAGLARAFALHLADSAVTRGLIGPREVPRLWDRHILNCASIIELIPPGATTVDVGSGAGLPGVAVAIARDDVHVTLVEPLQRRVDWLEGLISELDLANVSLVRGRAEELRGQLEVDISMARAVAALPVLAGWCLPLTRPGGSLLAVKGRTAPEELAASVPDLQRLGATGWRVQHCGEGALAEPTTVVVVTAGARPAAQVRAARRRGGSAQPRSHPRPGKGEPPGSSRRGRRD